MKKKIAKYMAFAVSGILLVGCAEQNGQQLQGSQIESALSESTSLEQETSRNRYVIFVKTNVHTNIKRINDKNVINDKMKEENYPK